VPIRTRPCALRARAHNEDLAGVVSRISQWHRLCDARDQVREQRGIVSADPVRVTHVVFDLHGGGMESLVGAMAKRFAGSDIRMSVVSLSGRAGRAGSAATPYLYRYESFKPLRGVSMLAPTALVRSLKRIGTDVVHLHTGAWFKGALAGRLAGAGVLYTEHGRTLEDPWLRRSLDRQAARWTDVVVCVSKPIHQYMQSVLHVPADRLRTIENGIDVERFSAGAPPLNVRARLGVPDDATLIGSVGRLEVVKGYDVLIDAFALLRARMPGPKAVFLVLCGDGSEREALLARAERAGVVDAVRLPGWVDDPVNLYRTLDVFVLPSRSEGASISLLEAMACGAVPVVSAVGANAETLGPSLKEQVVPPLDHRALATAIERTLLDPGRLAAARTLMRGRVEEHYDLRALTRRYEGLYRALALSAPNRGGR
jgi:glycosyltransferase involved in cell wall biosynthesis